MKTLKLINKYIKLLEQDQQTPAGPPADATEAPPAPAQAPEETSNIGDTGGENYLIRLAAAAFMMPERPSIEEMRVVSEVMKKFMSSSPNKVAETIEQYITSKTSSNNEIQSLLGKA